MSSLVVDWSRSLEEIEGNRSAQQLTDLDEAHFLRVGSLGFWTHPPEPLQIDDLLAQLAPRAKS